MFLHKLRLTTPTMPWDEQSALRFFLNWESLPLSGFRQVTVRRHHTHVVWEWNRALAAFGNRSAVIAVNPMLIRDACKFAHRHRSILVNVILSQR